LIECGRPCGHIARIGLACARHATLPSGHDQGHVAPVAAAGPVRRACEMSYIELTV